MAKADGSSPQKVNPFLIVVLGIALIAVVINFVVSKPNSPPAAAPPTVSPAPAATPVNPPTATNIRTTDNDNKTTVNIQTKDSGTPMQVKQANGNSVLNKNPFLTPSIYLTVNHSSGDQNQTPPPNQNGTTNQQQISTKPNDNNNQVVTPPSNDELRLGAIFQKAQDRVALVYFHGKGYILRENDSLKNSTYKVKNIDDNSIVLVSDDGQEKTLKLNEKSIKLKGGGQ